METIDLRSDTVTLPTAAMRESIFKAELGDDVFGEDPTTNQLEEMAAERMEKEAAILVASGTMGNLVSVLSHCGRGDEAILGDQSHTYIYEAGGIAALGGVHPRTVANRCDGTLRLEDIEAAIRADNVHFPRTRLICLENTHNRCGGAVLGPEYIERVATLAHDRGLKLHLDGARVFNAAVALAVHVKELTRHADSVSFCLSKGLSAPVGSVICGSKEFVTEARRIRKAVGGGMRQCGIIAAAGIEALANMIERLAEDHANARRLAEGIADIDGLAIDLERVQTNIVFFDIVDKTISADQLVRRLNDAGVRILQVGPDRMRAVTHYGIETKDVESALTALAEAMG